MTLSDQIPAGVLVAIDTPPFIYYIEEVLTFDTVVRELFELCIATGRNRAVTTVVTLAEALVGAYTSGRNELLEVYRDVLGNSENLNLIGISVEIAEQAAELRARYRLRLSDAFQIATALLAGATHFITNDRDLKRVTDLQVVVLSEVS